tara:strand:- start:196 stop:378 length:183 start_codon:yes stop_codon:yes gene_type:complete
LSKTIKNLALFGYPAEKIKWFCSGMQTSQVLGLTTINLLLSITFLVPKRHTILSSLLKLN